MKSGWAAAVLVGGSKASPEVLDSRRVEISDPEIPNAKQPYHAGFGTARDADDELKRLTQRAETRRGQCVDAVVKTLFACLALVSLSTPAFAQERVIGLLSLPEVFGAGACDHFDPREIPLHNSPDDIATVATIEVDQNWSFAPHGGCEGLEVNVHKGAQKDELPTREYDYEMPAAIVVDQHEGWFKIRLHQGTGWVKGSVVDRFMPLSDLFDEFTGVTGISHDFNGRLATAPGVVNGPIMMRVAPNQPVRVVEIRQSGGHPWVHVEVLSNSACTAAKDGPPKVISDGWLPLHDQKGEPTVWFSSRGC